MKLNPFRRLAAPVPQPDPKLATPEPQRTIPARPYRAWSLLLPPGFSNERR